MFLFRGLLLQAPDLQGFPLLDLSFLLKVILGLNYDWRAPLLNRLGSLNLLFLLFFVAILWILINYILHSWIRGGQHRGDWTKSCSTPGITAVSRNVSIWASTVYSIYLTNILPRQVSVIWLHIRLLHRLSLVLHAIHEGYFDFMGAVDRHILMAILDPYLLARLDLLATAYDWGVNTTLSLRNTPTMVIAIRVELVPSAWVKYLIGLFVLRLSRAAAQICEKSLKCHPFLL